MGWTDLVHFPKGDVRETQIRTEFPSEELSAFRPVAFLPSQLTHKCVIFFRDLGPCIHDKNTDSKLSVPWRYCHSD
jgi:hypothetical protein